jgi:hypothetical protein
MEQEKSDVYGVTNTFRIDNRTNQSPPTIQRSKNISPTSGGKTNQEIKNWNKDRAGQRADQATTQEKTQLDITEPGETIPVRITENIKEIADNLIDLLPGGVKVTF